MTRVAFLVTHLLGSGHLVRTLALARAFRSAGMRPLLLSGGMPASHLDTDGLDFRQIAPVRSDGTHFTRLLDADGAPASDALLNRRITAIAEALRTFEPDALITELYPFGRRVLGREFDAALDAAGALPSRPLILASIRDILAPPSSEKKAAAMEGRLVRSYDGVLVHSDPRIVPLEASWPLSPAVARLLRYTGFVATGEICPEGASGGDGADEILVTAGGGPVGRALFKAAAAASRLYPQKRWRLLVGGADAAEICAGLMGEDGSGTFFAQPVRPDYRQMLARAAAAVGQCGYNTAVDWLRAGVPGVFVPFAEGGEVEQPLRARALSGRFGYGLVPEDQITPGRLAEAVAAAVARGGHGLPDLSLDGAAESARIVKTLLEQRR